MSTPKAQKADLYPKVDDPLTLQEMTMLSSMAGMLGDFASRNGMTVGKCLDELLKGNQNLLSAWFNGEAGAQETEPLQELNRQALVDQFVTFWKQSGLSDNEFAKKYGLYRQKMDRIAKGENISLETIIDALKKVGLAPCVVFVPLSSDTNDHPDP